jgi:hypothetical protein
MKIKSVLLAAVLLLTFVSLSFAQSKETGAIRGTITDSDKAPLPGVTVTISSPKLMGTRSAVTDAEGVFRFPALPPGTYEIKAELPSFKTFIQQNIRLETTMSLSLDIVMTPSTVAEQVTVVAKSPTVDVKSSETASVTLGAEILQNIPFTAFAPDIVNMAPGVTNNVAYGASQDTGIAYSMDGVNVADPEAGSAWVFVDHNIIEEAKIMGVGLPAEYGNFTGVIFNIVTKSGGNKLSGRLELDFQGKKGDFPKGFWQTENNQSFLADFPDLTSPLSKLFDAHVELGGPIKKDKVWFYVGLQWYRTQDYPAGFPAAIDYKQPHSFFKLSAQPSPSTPMTLSVEVDTYNGIHRGGSATTDPVATVRQTSPEVVANFTLTHIFTPKTFMDVKAAYFWGYYYLEPEMGRDVNAHFDIGTNRLYDNASYYYQADRDRVQVNASLTHYAENFISGSHDFKFGVELERSHARSRDGYTGLNQTYYIDYTGYYGAYYGAGPQGQYLAYQWNGYDINTSYIRAEAFAQDSWQIVKRFNLNIGLRFSHNWGFVKGVSGSVFQTTRLAPRVGFSFDILGDKTTVLKVHYGQFTEAMLTAEIDRLNPVSAFNDFVTLLWNNDTSQYEEVDRSPASTYQVADGIKHPYMSQFTVSVERELFKDASFTISGIWRSWHAWLFHYDRATTWAPVDFTIAELNDQPVTVYERTSASDAHDFWIQNNVPGENPSQKYWGLEFLFNKRFSNRWQVLASYVYSHAYGTLNNSFGSGLGWAGGVDNPNMWVNASGTLANDPTHMIKVQGTYVLPWDINFNIFFQGITGDAWTTVYRSTYLTQGRATVNIEPRGSHHYPMAKTLDVRLEKTFLLEKKYRLGLIVDVFNVFNDHTITSWGNRYGNGADWLPGDYPSTDGHTLYGIINPRQARVGFRLAF